MEKKFYQPTKNNIKAYDNTQKIEIGQGDDFTTGCLLDYVYCKNYCKTIAAYSSKQ